MKYIIEVTDSEYLSAGNYCRRDNLIRANKQMGGHTIIQCNWIRTCNYFRFNDLSV